MVKFKGVDGALKESLHDVVDYIQYELRLDIEYALLYVVAPILVGLLVIQGTFGLFKYLYKWIVPPGASELHRYVCSPVLLYFAGSSWRLDSDDSFSRFLRNYAILFAAPH